MTGTEGWSKVDMAKSMSESLVGMRTELGDESGV